MSIVKCFETNKKVNQVIHLSDIHIRTGNITNSRYFEYNNIINNLNNNLKDIENIENTIIIITGDIFHHKNLIEPYGISLFNELINTLTNFTSTYIIRGNHDYRQDYNNLNNDNIELISSLISKYKNAHYLNKTGLYEIGDILVGVVAIQDVLKTGDTSGKIDLIKFPFTNKIYKHTIALFHGIITDNDNTIYNDAINIEWIKNYKFGMLGDIHKQEIFNAKWNDKGYYDIKDKDEIIWGYSGSLIQQNFGESYNKHGYLLWELNKSQVKSIDIPNKIAYLNLYFKTNWKIKIIDQNFNDMFINLNEFLINNNHINRAHIQIKNKNSNIEDLYTILKKHNVKVLSMSNKITNDNVFKVDNKNIDINIDTIKELNSLDTWYEYVNDKSSKEDKAVLDKFKWKNVIKNPDSLLINTETLPKSILEKIEKKNKTIVKQIRNYLSSNDTIKDTNNLKLTYMKWDWVLCYRDNCYYNFENMDSNVMLLNADNGCGKSSFLEIICIGLFGVSIPSRYNKQFSSSIICNKKPKGVGSNIQIIFQLNKKKYMINRNFGAKSNDKNKLEQKVEIYMFGEYEGTDNLIYMHSGVTAVNNWIMTNIGDSKTFFQSCMHTQNSDYDLFSMSYNDQKNIMDNSLSLQSINILIDIFKDSKINYKKVCEDVNTLYNELFINIEKVSKEQVDELYKEYTEENKSIDELDKKLQSNTFNIDIKDEDINLQEDEIDEMIEKYKIENNEDEDLSRIYEEYGEIKIIEKQYRDKLQYYNISKNGDRICSGVSILSNIVFEHNIQNYKNTLLIKIEKLIDLQNTKTKIDKYFSKNDTDNSITCSDSCDNYQDSIRIKNKELEKLSKSLRKSMKKLSNIAILRKKVDLDDKLSKLEKKKKLIKKKENELLKNKKNIEYIEEYEDKMQKNNKDIEYIEEQINKIKENDYPFNPDCECCLKQPWKIQLNDLEDSLSKITKNNEIITELINDKEKEIKSNLTKLKDSNKKLIKWIDGYNELLKDEKNFIKDRENYKIKEELEIDIDKIEKEIHVLEKDIKNIENKLEYKRWEEMREKNMKDMKEYEDFEKRIIEEYDEIEGIKEELENIIEMDKDNKEKKKKYKYWLEIKRVKPMWQEIVKDRIRLNKKRKYMQNITQKYLNTKKMYEEYIDKCETMKNYRELMRDTSEKLDGIEILSNMFNDYRVWLYKEKLFPLILHKLNNIIENMCKNDESLEVDIVWMNDNFNWFINHNDNKVIINKASGYQKFIIDLSMRITLATLGVTTLRCNQLFIDEGFSSCDSEHLSKIPEFLNSLLKIYGSILVVSHIQDIKNSTTSSYDINRDNNLSYIRYGNNHNEYINNLLKVVKRSS